MASSTSLARRRPSSRLPLPGEEGRQIHADAEIRWRTQHGPTLPLGRQATPLVLAVLAPFSARSARNRVSQSPFGARNCIDGTRKSASRSFHTAGGLVSMKTLGKATGRQSASTPRSPPDRGQRKVSTTPDPTRSSTASAPPPSPSRTPGPSAIATSTSSTPSGPSTTSSAGPSPRSRSSPSRSSAPSAWSADVRGKIAIRADLCWDDDRPLRRPDARRAARQPPGRSSSSSSARTPQGCEWLIGRSGRCSPTWPTRVRSWDAGQKRLAFDLLATPADFRKGQPGVEIDLDGNAINPEIKAVEVARREIAGLKARMEVDRRASTRRIAPWRWPTSTTTTTSS